MAVVGADEPAKPVSRGCKIMGPSRDSFYRFQELSEIGGEDALEEISRQLRDQATNPRGRS